MPWLETSPMQERVRFVTEYEQQQEPFSGLCQAYGISRQTGYKWIDRFEAGGLEGLRDLSRAPHHPAHAVGGATEQALLAVRMAHPYWGPRKIRAYLQRQQPQQRWPAASTIGEILRRAHRVLPRRRRAHATPSALPFAVSAGPNQVWCADYKGWFKTADGRRCDPLTISDSFSRYLLRCQVVDRMDYAQSRGWFEATFREFGLPWVIHTDNGSPFASTGLGGLSRLSVWWIRLGIWPERSRPAHPQDNGRHERMHLTVKQETASPPQATLRAQQRAFDRFAQEYNQQRPHEALDQQTPASVYEPSAREYPRRLPELAYPAGMHIARVRVHGQFNWRGREIFLGEALAGEHVGLEQQEDGAWLVHFGPMALGLVDEERGRVRAKRSGRLSPAPGPLRGQPPMPKAVPAPAPAADPP